MGALRWEKPLEGPQLFLVMPQALQCPACSFLGHPGFLPSPCTYRLPLRASRSSLSLRTK